MDLVQHGHHGAGTAGGAAEGLEALALRTDGVVDHHQGGDALVFPVGEQFKVAGQRLGPALLGVADGQGGGVPGKGQVGVLQTLAGRDGIVGLVQDLQVGAHLGQLVRVGLKHPHAHAAAHHQKVEQVVVGGEVVDHGKGAVVVGHGVLFGHRGAAHPQGTAGQELAQMVDVIVEFFRFFPGGGGQRSVVFHRAAHRLPPEFPAALVRQIAGIGAGVHKRAQLLHGVGSVLVGAEEFPAQDALFPVGAGALLLLLHPVQDVGLGGAVVFLFKQGFFHRVLDVLDIQDFLTGELEPLGDGIGDMIHRLGVMFPGGSRRQGDGPADKFSVERHDLAAALAYVHSVNPPVSIGRVHYI